LIRAEAWLTECDDATSTPAPTLAGRRRDGRLDVARGPYRVRIASAFSRQVAASWRKLGVATLRNKAAMMRRMLISSSPLASPGHGQLALSWQPSALIALAGVLVVALAGAWPLQAWTLAALTVRLGAPVLALVLAAAVLAGAGTGP
jgi:hypothetical protein